METTLKNNNLSKATLFGLFLGLVIIHELTTYLFLEKKLYLAVIAIHTYLLSMLGLGIFILRKVKSIDATKVGMTFLAITMFKMLFAICFLLLLFNLFDAERMVLILHFFAPFFMFLVIEVLLSLKEVR